MNCRGLPDKRRAEKVLQTKKNQTERNPAADFIFS